MVTPIATPPSALGRRPHMTYEEFLAWADDDIRAEWVDGEVIEFMPPKKHHILVIHYLLGLVTTYARLRRLGEVFGEPFQFLTRDGHAVRRPDIAVLLTAHLDRFTSEGMEGVPDLVVEVISEDSVARDRRDKWAEYAAAGIPEYWIVDGRDGRHGVDFYELQPDGVYAEIPPDAEGRVHSTTLTGFWLDPAWPAEDPLPDPDWVLDQIAPGIHQERVATIERVQRERTAGGSAETVDCF